MKDLPVCPVEVTLRLMGDKWKVLILRDLMNGTRRFGEVPPRVEYTLTETGLSLKPVLDAMVAWGTDYKNKQKEAAWTNE